MTASDVSTSDRPPRVGGRLFVILPLLVFFALAALFLVRLGAGDPSRIPSALIGRQVPSFDLPALAGRSGEGLADADLRQGHVTLVNVFASWCPECHDEHGLLLAMAADPKLKAVGVTLDGIVYKDKARTRAAIWGRRAIPMDAWASTRPAAPASISASTACPRLSSSKAMARLPTS